MDVKELLYLEIDQLGIDFIKTKIKENILNSEVHNQTDYLKNVLNQEVLRIYLILTISPWLKL